VNYRHLCVFLHFSVLIVHVFGQHDISKWCVLSCDVTRPRRACSPNGYHRESRIHWGSLKDIEHPKIWYLLLFRVFIVKRILCITLVVIVIFCGLRQKRSPNYAVRITEEINHKRGWICTVQWIRFTHSSVEIHPFEMSDMPVECMLNACWNRS